MENKLMVSVDMITYKHESFIKQAIEGVLMQKTNFEYDLIIADDCSPDNTEEIVRNIIATHPKGHFIKYFRHEKNIGMQPNGMFAVKQCKGKYIALCEGDDYWTDSNKLQKQVDFLENNSAFSLVGHFAVNSNNKMIGVFDKEDFSFEDIYFRNLSIPTASIVFRNNIEIPKWVKKVYGGDRALIFLCAKSGNLKVLPFVGSYYRIHSGGMEQQYKDDLKKSIRNINEHIVYYNLTKHLPKAKVLRKKIIKNHKDIILYCVYTFRFQYLIKAPYSLFLFLIKGRVYIN
jgi:glycosyltransferase involved in cell wall biosynthesis